jgi:hypothetical protein
MAKQVTIEGYTYSSIASAWRALAPTDDNGKILPLITVRWRLKHGWDGWHAFTTPPIDPKIRRNYKELR